jgi:hypothetical protein
MSSLKIMINVFVYLMFDISLGTLYGKFREAEPKSSMVEESEKAFRRREIAFHHGLLPCFDGYTFWHQRYRISTDNLGFKSQPFRQTALSPSRVRTVFLGDSFTEGIGVEYHRTFVGLFDSAYPRQEIVNMGVASYSPKLYKEKLRHYRAAGFEYDRLILCLDISDIQDEIVYNGMRARLDPRERRLYRFIESMSHYSLSVSLFQRLGRKTELYNRVVGYQWKYSEERSKWPDDEGVFNEWGKLGLKMAASNMDTIVDMQRSARKQMVLVIYPWPQQIMSGSFRNQQTSFWRDYCKSNGITLINLFDSFEQACMRMGKEKVMSDYFISGDVHWNENGHAFVFRALDSALRASNIGL